VGPKHRVKVALSRPGEKPFEGEAGQAALETTLLGEQLGEAAVPLVPQFDRSRHARCRLALSCATDTVHMNGVRMNRIKQKYDPLRRILLLTYDAMYR